jgi:hypothetical protein
MIYCGALSFSTGSVIVSTPQDVALSDVRKGIAMLRKVSVPVGFLPSSIHYTPVLNSCALDYGICLESSFLPLPNLHHTQPTILIW